MPRFEDLTRKLELGCARQREEAARSLGAQNDRRALPSLRAACGSDPDACVRRAAREALRQLGWVEPEKVPLPQEAEAEKANP